MRNRLHERHAAVAVGLLALAAGLLVHPLCAQAQDAGALRAFLDKLWPVAQTRGISRPVFDRATADLVPDPEVLQLAGSQPEQVKPPGVYLTDLVTPERIAAGRRKLAEHADLLAAIEAAYGVDRHILLAVWGIESYYGTLKGTRAIVRSLATLAIADARRANFWRSELLAALRILQDGVAAPSGLIGSWAGATGHTQFMPSTYVAHAVDFDKDGRRDIWETVADALASTANVLRASGWAAGVPWGFEVTLPAGFDYAWSAPGRARTWEQWQAADVRGTGGRAASDQPLALRLPAGARGPAFLVSGNFRVLLRYNNATPYALAVGHLADRIAGGAPLAAPWPSPDQALGRSEREELQRLLMARGLDTGGLDGIIGDQTRAAIRATQRALALAEDGHPSAELLQRLRGAAAP